MKAASIALNVNPKKNGPSGRRKYLTISSTPANSVPVIGPNRKSTIWLGMAEKPILTKGPMLIEATELRISASAASMAQAVSEGTALSSPTESRNRPVHFFMIHYLHRLSALSTTGDNLPDRILSSDAASAIRLSQDLSFRLPATLHPEALDARGFTLQVPI